MNSVQQVVFYTFLLIFVICSATYNFGLRPFGQFTGAVATGSFLALGLVAYLFGLFPPKDEDDQKPG